MFFHNIFNYLLELCTGLPSQATFIEKHVVPAKPDDKFYNNRCGICWGDYDAEHPRSNIPYGHVFGLGCIHDMVKSPTGEHCPFCQKKLFRPGLAKLVGDLLAQAFVIYFFAVDRTMFRFYRIEDYLMQQVPWLVTPLYILYNGPAGIASVFISKFTNLGTRNSKLVLRRVFSASKLLPLLLRSGALFAPLLLPVYHVFGLRCFLWTFFVLDFLSVLQVYETTIVLSLPLIEQVDQAAVESLTAWAVAMRQLLVL